MTTSSLTFLEFQILESAFRKKPWVWSPPERSYAEFYFYYMYFIYNKKRMYF